MLQLTGHALGVTAVAVLASGAIVSGAMDKTIRVWSPATVGPGKMLIMFWVPPSLPTLAS